MPLITHQFGKYLGVETYVLSPSETKDLYPLMNVDDIYATLYSPGRVCMFVCLYVCLSVSLWCSPRGRTCPLTPNTPNL